jgi:hypothetical protein
MFEYHLLCGDDAVCGSVGYNIGGFKGFLFPSGFARASFFKVEKGVGSHSCNVFS